MTPRPSIIVPLYIYPSPGAWSALYESIEKYPHVHFWVVVNPGNGPGADQLPDENYQREIPQLNAYKNVTVLGYVHVSWTKRELSDVLKDIDTYSHWRTDSQIVGLSVSGIFVDETPGEFDPTTEKYLGEVKKTAKSLQGLGHDRTIVHNPGTVAHAELAKHADITIAFEDTLPVFTSRFAQGVFDQYKSGSTRFGFIRKANRRKQAKVAVIVHSVPPSMDVNRRRDIVKQSQEVADYLFFTDLDTDYYQHFSSNWLEWVDAVAQ